MRRPWERKFERKLALARRGSRKYNPPIEFAKSYEGTDVGVPLRIITKRK